MRGLIFCFLVALNGRLVTDVPAPATAAGSSKNAEQVTREFYGWYLGSMVKDKEPTDDPARYTRYVSAPLRAKIKRQMDSPKGMDADYFIKAQDYLPDWPGHITTGSVTTNANMARVSVMLGTDRRHPWRLGVALVKEAGNWRVLSVQQLH